MYKRQITNGTPGFSDEITFTGNPTADDNANGLSNLLDHALGNTLTGTEAYPVITTATANDGNGLQDFLAISYRANLADPSLTFLVEVSPDLVNWADGPIFTDEVERVDQGDGTANFVIRSLTSVADLENQFIRLKVVQTP